MGDVCTDGRFDLIERFKRDLVEATNIETSPEEMAVLDSILFRMWQMGWLDRLEQPPASPWHRVEDELPDVDEKVLVFAVGKLDGFIGDTVIALTSMSDTNWLNHHEKVDKPYWLDPWQYFLTDYRITHWMPLPEPPKEEEYGN